MPPTTDAWAAGGLAVILGLILGAMTIVAAILFWKRMPPGRNRDARPHRDPDRRLLRLPLGLRHGACARSRR
jgi:hypothetical protein